MENEFYSPEDFLTTSGLSVIQERLGVVETLKVFLHAVICIYPQQNRLRKIEEFKEGLLPIYDHLSISRENATDEIDQAVLNHQQGVVDVLVKKEYLGRLKDRFDYLLDICV